VIGSSGPYLGQPTLPSGEDRSLEIFISYRREDAAAHAGRLTQAIDRAVGHCDVLIALIGPHWLDASNMRGRRLDDPHDLVRLEIQAALARDIRVIPTLVGGARMPDADELPGELASLSKRNAIELTHARFQSDLQLLLKPLEKIAEQKGLNRPVDTPTAIVTPSPPSPHAPTQPKSPPAPSRRMRRVPLIAAAAALALLVGIAGWVGLTRLGANRIIAQNAAAAMWPASYIGTWKGTGHEFSPSADFAITLSLKPGKVGQTVGHIDRPSLGCVADLTLDKATAQSITLTEQGGGGTCAVGNQNVTGSKIVLSLHNGTVEWKEYEGDPSSSSATSTAILGQGASGPIAGTSTFLGVPDAFLGTWRGTGHESSPSADFAITIIIRVGQVGETVATMDRPTLGCNANLTLDKATAQSIVLTEQGGGGTCAVSNQNVTGSKLVLILTGTSIDWKEYPGDPSTNPAIASATLSTG
jgi:hypothetical protein